MLASRIFISARFCSSSAAGASGAVTSSSSASPPSSSAMSSTSSAEPLSRRGVARAPNANQIRSSEDYIRNPLLAATLATKKVFPDGYYADGQREPLADVSLAGVIRHGFKWFQRQRQMGANSGWIILFWTGICGWIIYKFLANYVWPWKQEQPMNRPRFRQGFNDSHNLMFGMGMHDSTGYEPIDIMAAKDEKFERPRLIATEGSDKLPLPSKYVVMQLREFDEKEGVDFFTRSLHVVDWPEAPPPKRDSPATGTNVNAPAVRLFDQGKPLKSGAEIYEGERTDEDRQFRPSWWQRSFGIFFNSSSDANSSDKNNKENKEGSSSASAFGSASRKETDMNYVHGMVRCSAITPLDNCVLDQGRVPLEVVRKMLCSLGPLHILRDPLNIYIPMRMYLKREPKQDLLFLGSGNCAALPNFIHRQYPHYVCDVVEQDGGLVRALRKYFGFKEKSKLNLFVEEPAEYVRRVAATSSSEKGGQKLGSYDAIYVDMVNEQGIIPREYSRLEFLNNVRDCLSGRGILCINVPNSDDRILQSVVSNVRMVFDGRSVVLLHCRTSNNTIVMTFNDMLGKGYPKFGDCSDPEQYKELMKTWIRHYHEERRMPLDLLNEIDKDTFQTLLPGKRYVVRNPAHQPR